MSQPLPEGVADRFADSPAEVCDILLRLRDLIFEVAEEIPEVGELEESLKWGEPAYRPRNGVGTTVRFDWKERDPDHIAVLVHCQTTLIERWRARFPRAFEFEGSRAARFRWREPLPEHEIRQCLADALTYHLER